MLVEIPNRQSNSFFFFKIGEHFARMIGIGVETKKCVHILLGSGESIKRGGFWGYGETTNVVL